MIFILWLSGGIIKDPQIINTNFYPNVSIIVSAHNEEKNIKNLLNILINQEYQSEYEIIIANDRSNDSTKDIINNYIKDYQNIKLVDINETPIGWGHKKWALNLCIEKSQYDIILQTDADCIPTIHWIQSMVDNFSDPNVSFISGPAPMMSDNNKLSSYYKLDSLAQDSLSAAALSRNFVLSCTGRNMGFLKKSFFDINGYEGIEHYKSGDDDLLMQKFATLLNEKLKFSFHPNSVVISDPPSSIKEFFNQRIRYASKGFDYYKLQTSNEFKIALPFLYLVNFICLLNIIFFIQSVEIIYLFPITIKTISDYWICSIFFDKINQNFTVFEFLVLALLHPIYVVSLGLLSPFINYNWKDDV